MLWNTYLKNQTRCLLRSNRLLSLLMMLVGQVLLLLLLRKYASVYGQVISIYSIIVVSFSTKILVSENIFGWLYGGVLLLYTTPTPLGLYKTTPYLFMPFLCIAGVALIEFALFFVMGGLSLPVPLQVLFGLSFCVNSLYAYYHVLVTSIKNALPLKKNDFSFTEKYPPVNGTFVAESLITSLLPTALPMTVFYITQECTTAWYVFAVLCSVISVWLFCRQICSIPQKLYHQRFHLYQVLSSPR